METFDWCPRVNPVSSNKFRTLVAQFGDGYAQRAGDGINLKGESWPLEFVGTGDTIGPIREFLDRHQGFKSFLWKPPMGVLQHFVTPDGYNLTPLHADLYTLTVTFEQNNRLVP